MDQQQSSSIFFENWKESFRQEGSKALENKNIRFEDAIKKIDWGQITKNLFNAQAANHHILVRKNQPSYQSIDNDYMEVINSNMSRDQPLTTKVSIPIKDTMKEMFQKKILNQTDVLRSPLKKVKRASTVHQENDIVYPVKIMTLRKDIEQLAEEQKSSQRYFETFKTEREKRIHTLMNKKRLQRVNIDDAVFGTQIQTHKTTINTVSEAVIKEDKSKREHLAMLQSKFLKLPSPARNLEATQASRNHQEKAQARNALTQQMETSLKFRAYKQYHDHLKNKGSQEMQPQTNQEQFLPQINQSEMADKTSYETFRKQRKCESTLNLLGHTSKFYQMPPQPVVNVANKYGSSSSPYKIPALESGNKLNEVSKFIDKILKRKRSQENEQGKEYLATLNESKISRKNRTKFKSQNQNTMRNKVHITTFERVQGENSLQRIKDAYIVNNLYPPEVNRSTFRSLTGLQKSQKSTSRHSSLNRSLNEVLEQQRTIVEAHNRSLSNRSKKGKHHQKSETSSLRIGLIYDNERRADQKPCLNQKASPRLIFNDQMIKYKIKETRMKRRKVK